MMKGLLEAFTGILSYVSRGNLPYVVGTNQILMVKAIKQNNIVAIQELLNSGKVDLEDKLDYNARTALHYAARYGNEETLKLFLKRGADANALDSSGFSPLLHALKPTYEDGITHLPKFENATLIIPHVNAATLNMQEIKTREVPLHYPAIYDPEALSDPLDPNSPKKHPQVLECLKAILEKGAMPDIYDIRGYTPLFYATAVNHKGMVGPLLEYGANPDIEAKNGETVLAWALRGYSHLPSHLTDKQKTNYKLNSKENAELILKTSNKHINTKVTFHDTKETLIPLFHAIETCKNYELTKLLINYGADIDLTDEGKNALALAVKHNLTDIAGLILSKSKTHIDTMVKDDAGNETSALSYTVKHGMIELFSILIKQGAYIDMKEFDIVMKELEAEDNAAYSQIKDILNNQHIEKKTPDNTELNPLENETANVLGDYVLLTEEPNAP